MALQDNAVAHFGTFMLALVNTESKNLIKIQKSSNLIYKPLYPEVLCLIFHILTGLQGLSSQKRHFQSSFPILKVLICLYVTAKRSEVQIYSEVSGRLRTQSDTSNENSHMKTV